MMHSTEITDQSAPNFKGGDIQYVCEQLKAYIESILSEAQSLSENEKFEKLHKLNELKQILSSIEDIDHSVDALLEQQLQKRTTEIH